MTYGMGDIQCRIGHAHIWANTDASRSAMGSRPFPLPNQGFQGGSIRVGRLNALGRSTMLHVGMYDRVTIGSMNFSQSVLVVPQSPSNLA
jgi:hypothetical protein